jgi:hypothetical protein
MGAKMIPSPIPIPKPAKKDFMRHSWETYFPNDLVLITSYQDALKP